jgi:hypothetical protein
MFPLKVIEEFKNILHYFVENICRYFCQYYKGVFVILLKKSGSRYTIIKFKEFILILVANRDSVVDILKKKAFVTCFHKYRIYRSKNPRLKRYLIKDTYLHIRENTKMFQTLKKCRCIVSSRFQCTEKNKKNNGERLF